MIDRITLPPGDLSRRLNALGWSLRGFADEIGEDEATLRRWDAGIAAARASVLAWLEREEKHRARHPMPVRPGGELKAGRPKQRRRSPGTRGLKKSEASEPSAPPALPEPTATTDADRLRVMLDLLRPAPLPPLGPRPPGPMTHERFLLIDAYLGWTAREFADRIGAPAVARTYRRWKSGRDQVKAETADWLEELGALAASRPPKVIAWHRMMAEHRRLIEMVVKALTECRPVDDGEWEGRLDAVARRRPEKLAPRPTEWDEPDPKRPMRLDEIL